MARIRTTKPEFWKSEKLAQRLPGADGRQARLLFKALWNFAEDHGVMRGHPAYVRSEVFPYDDDVSVADVDRWLSMLAAGGFITRYQVDGSSYLWIAGFREHQRIEKPSKTTLPLPPEPSPTTPGALPEPSRLDMDREVVGGEEMEREVEPSPPPSEQKGQGAPQLVQAPTAPPENWLAHDFWAWAQSKRLEAGLPPERRPGRNLDSWWSQCLMLVECEAMQEAFYRFGEDPHWQAKTPPLPFNAFVSQWEKYLPKGSIRAVS